MFFLSQYVSHKRPKHHIKIDHLCHEESLFSVECTPGFSLVVCCLLILYSKGFRRQIVIANNLHAIKLGHSHTYALSALKDYLRTINSL